MIDGPSWTFAELRRLLNVPEAIDFRYSAAWVDENGHLARRDYLVAVMPEGWKPGGESNRSKALEEKK